MRRGFLLFAATLLFMANIGCQAPYVLKSAWSQADLLLSRKPIDDVLKDEKLSADDREKIELAREAKKFGEDVLGLKKNSNYKSFVRLDRDYVSYVVSAAAKDELKAHAWWFPFVGSVPYKGYFNPDDAKSLAEEMNAEGFDTYVRGVSAYSTLGWFNDPVLSSMLRYSRYDLVNTIIHESVHATVFIKSKAEFNERLATFIGNAGADLFFTRREGSEGASLREAKEENHDEKLFAEFISREIDDLEKWYAEKKQSDPNSISTTRSERFKKIEQAFAANLKPKLKNRKYIQYLERELKAETLNNARLLAWRLYIYDLSDFEKVFAKLDSDPKKMIEFAKSLEKEKDPEAALKTKAAAN